MFTGIIETVGKVIALQKEGGNLQLTIESKISFDLKIDQSVSHNGVCLTVVEVEGGAHRVTAVDETLQKTNLGLLKLGDEINLERCTKLGDRLDGHIVQGHVDQTAAVVSVITNNNQSWIYTFRYSPSKENLIVEKGSVTVNGISLTAFDVKDHLFSVAIIPYTYGNTSMKGVAENSIINLEFDVIGKYVAKILSAK